MVNKLGLGALVTFLVPWYVFNSPSEEQTRPKQYALPNEIAVVETTLPYETGEREFIVDDSAKGMSRIETKLEKAVKTEDIDFSKDFEIKTDRYHFSKGEDMWVSRQIGKVLSLPAKLLFWDWDAGLGQDAERTRASLAMLENNPDIKDITLRINHNRALYDMTRMFWDDKLTERNNILARILLGIPASLGSELFMEFGRGDYYNPFTRTAVGYSNIESITAHELGHNKDFSRFTSDWEYSLANIIPGVQLYKEAVASKRAKGEILDKRDDWQFYRYLIPAFATYVLATFNGLAAWKKIIKRKRK